MDTILALRKFHANNRNMFNVSKNEVQKWLEYASFEIVMKNLSSLSGDAKGLALEKLKDDVKDKNFAELYNLAKKCFDGEFKEYLLSKLAESFSKRSIKNIGFDAQSDYWVILENHLEKRTVLEEAMKKSVKGINCFETLLRKRNYGPWKIAPMYIVECQMLKIVPKNNDFKLLRKCYYGSKVTKNEALADLCIVQMDKIVNSITDINELEERLSSLHSDLCIREHKSYPDEPVEMIKRQIGAVLLGYEDHEDILVHESLVDELDSGDKDQIGQKLLSRYEKYEDILAHESLIKKLDAPHRNAIGRKIFSQFQESDPSFLESVRFYSKISKIGFDVIHDIRCGLMSGVNEIECVAELFEIEKACPSGDEFVRPEICRRIMDLIKKVQLDNIPQWFVDVVNGEVECSNTLYTLLISNRSRDLVELHDVAA